MMLTERAHRVKTKTLLASSHAHTYYRIGRARLPTPPRRAPWGRLPSTRVLT